MYSQFKYQTYHIFFGWWVYVRGYLARGLLSSGYMSGGICPGGICPGGICPRTENTPSNNINHNTIILM